jgi:hypothetical protein
MIYRLRLLPFLGGALALGLFAGLTVGGAVLVYRGLTGYNRKDPNKSSNDYVTYAEKASRM